MTSHVFMVVAALATIANAAPLLRAPDTYTVTFTTTVKAPSAPIVIEVRAQYIIIRSTRVDIKRQPTASYAQEAMVRSSMRERTPSRR